MKIVDLSPESEPVFFCCLEEWSDDMKEAGDHKQNWYERVKDRGLRVKLARDENDIAVGMIQYLPVEQSMFKGKNLHVILCIWVHGHKEGIGNHQKQGIGKALLTAAEEDCRELGSSGIVAWGLGIPVWMRASWFKKQGFRVVDKSGIIRLLWKPFREDAIPPQIIRKKKKPAKGKEKVDISVFKTGWCPTMNLAYERTLRAAEEFKEKVQLNEYDAVDRAVVEEWGISDGIYIDGKELRTGPPPPYEKVRKKIAKRARKKKPANP